VTIKGVDVASYQPEAFTTTGLDFVFVKVTEGTGYVNPKWVAQRDHGRAAGLAIGYYHFVKPGSMIAQADFFLSEISLRPGDMLVLDWEHTGVSCADKDAWIRHVQAKAPGHRVLLYCNLDFWRHRDTTSFAGDGLWIADPNHPAGHPAVTHPWVVHQFSSVGGTDRNVAAFPTLAALTRWAAGAEPEEDPMAGMSDKDIADAVLNTDGVFAIPAGWRKDNPKNDKWKFSAVIVTIGDTARRIEAKLDAQTATIKTLAEALAARDQAVDVDALVARIQQAIESVTVHLDVNQPAEA
jgi:Glycosyl hydrolases family 25